MTDLGWNAGTGIFHFYQYTITHLRSCDVNRAAARHGFQSVREQVQEYALHAGSGHRYLDSRRHVQQNFNVVALRHACGFAGRYEDRAQVTAFDGLGVPSRETREFGEEISHSAGSPVNVGGDPHGVRRRKICGEQHFGASANGGQWVAQIMDEGGGPMIHEVKVFLPPLGSGEGAGGLNDWHNPGVYRAFH